MKTDLATHLQLLLRNFEQIAELRYHQIIDPGHREWVEEDEDSITASYSLAVPMNLDAIRMALSGHLLLYRRVPSKMSTYGHSLCVFSRPLESEMVKFNAVTGDGGKAMSVSVTIYSSAELMRLDLQDELERVQKLASDDLMAISLHDLIVQFV